MSEHDDIFAKLNTSKIDITTATVAMNIIGTCIGGIYNGIFTSIRTSLKNEKRDAHVPTDKIADIALEIFQSSLHATVEVLNQAIASGQSGDNQMMKELHGMLSQFVTKPGHA